MITIYYPNRQNPELQFTVETQGDKFKIVKCEQLIDVHPGIEDHWADVTKYVNILVWKEKLEPMIRENRPDELVNYLFDLGKSLNKAKAEGF